MIPRESIALQKLHARNQLDDLQLLNLVIQPPDLRLVQFHAPKLVRLRHAHLLDALDRLGPHFERRFAQLFVSLLRRRDGIINSGEHAPIAIARLA